MSFANSFKAKYLIIPLIVSLKANFTSLNPEEVIYWERDYDYQYLE
jgi:hypothetical protein